MDENEEAAPDTTVEEAQETAESSDDANAPLEPPRTITAPAIKRSRLEQNAFWQALGAGAAAALFACLLHLHRLAEATLPHILSPTDPLQFQEILPGVPLTRLLDWNLLLIEILQVAQGMNAPLRLVIAAILWGCLLRIAVAVLNPSFRLLRAPQSANLGLFAPERWVLTLERRYLMKTLHVLLVVGLPMVLLWGLATLLPPRLAGTIWAVRSALVGAALWIGFHRYGLAGNFARPQLHRGQGRWLRQGLVGAFFGLFCFALFQAFVPATLQPRLIQYHTLGTFHQGYWWEIARGYFGAVAGVGFTIGTLLCALGRSHLSPRKRVTLLGLASLGLVFAWAAERPFTPQAMAARMDLTPAVQRGITTPYDSNFSLSGVPNGPSAAQEFARLTGIPMVPKRLTRDVLIFDNGVRITRQQMVTDDNLSSDPESVQKAQAFLRRKSYKSALSWIATRYLYNVGCIHFDVTASLSACLEDLTHGPHLSRTLRPLREMLFTCATSEQNQALLDRLANDRDFIFPDRDSSRMMGDLYRRFGEVEKALAWYRRAEMPRSFMQRIRTERPMFHAGTVTGRFQFNGKPLVGMQVGVLPIRQNGLPHDLEGRLLNAVQALAPNFYIPRFIRFDNFRAICASSVTDAQGNFTINHLVEGEYLLVCTLLPTPVPQQFEDSPQPVPRIVVNYDHPRLDMGTISVVTAK